MRRFTLSESVFGWFLWVKDPHEYPGFSSCVIYVAYDDLHYSADQQCIMVMVISQETQCDVIILKH